MKKLCFNSFDEGGLLTYEREYLTDRELIEIFPEAKNIIPLKINEWLRRKEKILAKETIPYLKKVNALKDEFAKAFWKEAYVYFAGGFNSCMAQLKRLRRLETLISHPERSRKFERLIETAKETPIVSVYEFQKLRKTGKGYIACCPIHREKTPSFHIYSATNSWYCFGCHRGGDAINFIQSLEKMRFREAVMYLAGGAK